MAIYFHNVLNCTYTVHVYWRAKKPTQKTFENVRYHHRSVIFQTLHPVKKRMTDTRSARMPFE